MSPLKSAAASVILQKLIERHLERRSAPGEKLLRGLALLMVLMACILLMVAGYRWLDAHFNPVEAPALAALVVFVVGLAVWAVAESLVNQRPDPLQNAEQKVMQAAKDIFADVESDLGGSIKEHPRAALSVAAVIGFLLARRLL